MEKTKAVIGYLINSYPYKNQLSLSRLTKMLYLADWKSSIKNMRQITQIEWEISYSGPFSEEIEGIINNDDVFLFSTKHIEGCGVIRTINLRRYLPSNQLSYNEKLILDYVIEVTKNLDWKSFLEIVYSTYPIVMKERYSKINLPLLANEYKFTKKGLVFA